MFLFSQGDKSAGSSQLVLAELRWGVCTPFWQPFPLCDGSQDRVNFRSLASTAVQEIETWIQFPGGSDIVAQWLGWGQRLWTCVCDKHARSQHSLSTMEGKRLKRVEPDIHPMWSRAAQYRKKYSVMPIMAHAICISQRHAIILIWNWMLLSKVDQSDATVNAYHQSVGEQYPGAFQFISWENTELAYFAAWKAVFLSLANNVSSLGTR